MCGLFGYQLSAEFPAHQRGVLGYLLGRSAESRGHHACGFAGYNGEQITINKEQGSFTTSKLPATMGEYLTIIGHTRYATVGAHTVDNAHPFRYKHVIGAHNGGIFNHIELDKQYEERNFTVDSQHLIAHIADEADMAELEGYGAVTWYDTRDPGAVYLCRMSASGDLDADVLPDGQGIVWASTRGILSAALSPLDIYAKSKSFSLAHGVVYRVVDNTITETDQSIKITAVAKKSKHSGTVVQVWDSVTGTWSQREARSSEPTWYERQKQAAESNAKAKALTGNAVKNPDVVGSVTTEPRGSSKRNRRRAQYEPPPACTYGHADPYRAAVASYDRDLDHYLRGVEQAQLPLDRKAFDDETLGDLLALRFDIREDRYESIAEYIDMMPRRRRRRLTRVAREVLQHANCTCKKCDKLLDLLAEIDVQGAIDSEITQ